MIGETVDDQGIKIQHEEIRSTISKISEEAENTAEKNLASVEKAFTKELDVKRERIVFIMANNERRRRGIPLKRRRGFATAERNERRQRKSG